MSEQSSQPPSPAIGSIAVHGRQGSASGAAVAQRIAAAVAQAGAGVTRSQHIATLRIELPTGASEAQIARAIARALAAGTGR